MWEKMSKSKSNGVDPGEVVARFRPGTEPDAPEVLAAIEVYLAA